METKSKNLDVSRYENRTSTLIQIYPRAEIVEKLNQLAKEKGIARTRIVLAILDAFFEEEEN